MSYIIITLLVLIGFIVLFFWKGKPKELSWRTPTDKFPKKWREILSEYVPFYHNLNQDDKEIFEYKVQEFLMNCDITGVDTDVTATDELLVASSAIIPIFGFEDWRYYNLDEVILYSAHFNNRFETDGEGRNILGMVGTGHMEGKMAISKPALYHGFKNESDKKNTAIHEFVHLIDKLDGNIDGIPKLLMERQYAIPWMKMMQNKINEIYEEKSDMNPYGGTNKAEFFSVASEYFFERPKLLERKHPELYALLEQIFKQDMAEISKKS